MPRYVGLSPSRCAGFYWQRFRDFRHAASRHSAPIAAPEGASAAAHLPLVFTRMAGGQGFELSALLGLADGVNHFIDASNQWIAGYIPAVERTHPFRVLPVTPESTERTLCVDLDSPWVAQGEGEPFFGADHQPAPAVREVLGVLKDLEVHFYRTQQAVEALASHKLLTPWTLEAVGGKAVQGLYRIDEKAFHGLSDTAFSELRRKGAVAIAYTQMISSHQLPVLQKRAGRAAATELVDLESLFSDDDDLSFNA